jgi:hypothetical protein
MKRWCAIPVVIVALCFARGAGALTPSTFRSAQDCGISRSVNLLADLDGDGNLDSVQVEFHSWRGSAQCSFEYVVVRTGRRELTLASVGLSENAAIVDLDSTDARHELELAEKGPSDDPMVAFIALDARGLYVVGKIGSGDLRIRGDGFVEANGVRGEILQTWYHPQMFVLARSESLVAVRQALYPMRTDVVLKLPLTLVRSPHDLRPAFTLKPGDRAQLRATDDVEWVMLATPAGRLGWFRVADRFMVGGHDAQDVFDGLLLAD